MQALAERRPTDNGGRVTPLHRHEYRPLVPVAVAVVAGVALDRIGGIGLGWAAAAAVCLLAWCFSRRRGAAWLTSTLLLAAVASSAAAWGHLNWRLFQADDLGRFARQASTPVCLEGSAVGGVSERAAPSPTPLRAIPQGEKTTLRVRVSRLRDGARWRDASGIVEIVVDGHLLGVHAGDRLRVLGQLRGGGEPLNPGQFDFAADARADRTSARVRCASPDCVSVVARGSGWLVWRWLQRVRDSFGQTLARRLGPRRAPIAAAMLLGARDGVARDRAEAYRRTGMLHVLVVSGLHVGLVVGGFYAAARVGWFPRRPTLVVVMLLILGYTLLAGARPPAVRAAVLAEVMCLAALTGRSVLALNSLAAATVIVLAINPAELFRSGAQLSFIAAATLIWYGSRQLAKPPPAPIDRLLAAARPAPQRALLWLGRSTGMLLAATLVVWLVTAPLLMHRFHLLSPIAVPASLAVFPLVSVAVISGLAMLVAELAAPPLAGLLSYACGASIDTLETVVDLCARAPGGSVWLGGPAGWWTVGVYLLLGSALLGGRFVGPPPRFAKVLTAWIALGFLAAVATGSRPEAFRCSFLSVGHGCAVLVESPERGVLLYDAGSLGSPEAAAETISGVLWSRGIRRIDALVLSHADVDHFNAAPELFARFSVGGVYVSPAMFDESETPDSETWSAPAALRRAIAASETPLHVLRQGDRLRIGQLTARVFHPIDDLGDSDNASSLVLAIEHRGRRVLLPGDLEGDGLELLTCQMPYDCDVLLAPHHGSARSDPPGFAAWSRPEWVIVSGGIGAKDSQLAGRSYAAAGAQVLRTAELGMVELDLSPEGVVCRAFRPDTTGR